MKISLHFRYCLISFDKSHNFYKDLSSLSHYILLLFLLLQKIQFLNAVYLLFTLFLEYRRTLRLCTLVLQLANLLNSPISLSAAQLAFLIVSLLENKHIISKCYQLEFFLFLIARSSILTRTCDSRYLYLHPDIKRNASNILPVSIMFIVGFWQGIRFRKFPSIHNLLRILIKNAF